MKVDKPDVRTYVRVTLDEAERFIVEETWGDIRRPQRRDVQIDVLSFALTNSTISPHYIVGEGTQMLASGDLGRRRVTQIHIRPDEVPIAVRRAVARARLEAVSALKTTCAAEALQVAP